MLLRVSQNVTQLNNMHFKVISNAENFPSVKIECLSYTNDDYVLFMTIAFGVKREIHYCEECKPMLHTLELEAPTWFEAMQHALTPEWGAHWSLPKQY